MRRSVGPTLHDSKLCTENFNKAQVIGVTVKRLEEQLKNLKNYFHGDLLFLLKI